MPATVQTDAKSQLESFFDKYDPKIAALGRKACAYLRKRLPGAVVMVYDNYNYLAIGFGPQDKVSTTPISIALYPRWINLYFLYGVRLDDPKGLLKGAGSRVRSIRMETFAPLKDPEVEKLISQAVLDVGWKLDRSSSGQLLIKAISARQRPRRP